jgi:hypothetical protein
MGDKNRPYPYAFEKSNFLSAKDGGDLKKLLLSCCVFVTAVLAGNTGRSILVIGDSNTEQGFITHSLADSLLAYVGAPSSMGTGYIPINSGFYEVRDGRVPNVSVSYPSSWTLMDMFEGQRLQTKPYLSPSGHWLKSSTVDAVATVKFPGNGVDVYWLADANGGKFQILIDNVARDTLNTAGSRSVQKTSVTGIPSGNHTMHLKVISVPVNGNVTLLGFDGRNDIAGIANRSVVHNWGNGYSASIDFVNIDSVVFATGLQKLAPDVVVLLIGTNDHLQDKRSAPEFKANLKVILNRIKAAGFENKILLVSTFMTHSSDGSGATFIPQYRATSWPEAAKETGVSYWDMSTWFGDDDAQWLYFDGVHCWDVCGKRIAPEMLRQLITRFPPVSVKQSRVPVATDSKLRPIFKSGRLLVPVAGECRFRIEITDLNGNRVIIKYGNAMQNSRVECGHIPLSTGIYVIKVHGSGTGAVWRIPVNR